jgi:hypothetical protein
MEQYMADLEKPLADRYIQRIVTTESGGILIYTFEQRLAVLIHQAPSLLVDTTFKRAAGDLNEWEISIWYPNVNRCTSSFDSCLSSIQLIMIFFYTAVTIGRVYTNHANRAHYKLLFDELQKVIVAVTGRSLRFRQFSQGGTLLALNVDMEAAQVLGAGDSFLPTNEPEYSGIETRDSAVLMTYVTRVCYTHVKRFAIIWSVLLFHFINRCHLQTNQRFQGPCDRLRIQLSHGVPIYSK